MVAVFRALAAASVLVGFVQGVSVDDGLMRREKQNEEIRDLLADRREASTGFKCSKKDERCLTNADCCDVEGKTCKCYASDGKLCTHHAAGHKCECECV
eukprot:SRR837773.4154.p2 GENE.SRR837773.4154~~SRR837773.4154.p2  ORF type:complete len:112 (+),score=24.01 SRR837773.4154:40-336(+)